MILRQAFLVIPEFFYLFLLLGSWLAAMFTGIAFAYGIQMHREKRTILFWGCLFLLCLLLIFLLMHGGIISG